MTGIMKLDEGKILLQRDVQDRTVRGEQILGRTYKERLQCECHCSGYTRHSLALSYSACIVTLRSCLDAFPIPDTNILVFVVCVV